MLKDKVQIARESIKNPESGKGLSTGDVLVRA